MTSQLHESLEEMVKTITTEKPDHAEVVAWRLKRDKRPLYVEGVILFLCWKEPKISFMLANLFKHPQHRNEWELSDYYYYGSKRRAYRKFDVIPTPDQIYEFLGDINWFRISGFKILAGLVFNSKTIYFMNDWIHTRKEPLSYFDGFLNIKI